MGRSESGLWQTRDQLYNGVENVLTRRRSARESDRRGRFCVENTVDFAETIHGEKSGKNS